MSKKQIVISNGNINRSVPLEVFPERTVQFQHGILFIDVEDSVLLKGCALLNQRSVNVNALSEREKVTSLEFIELCVSYTFITDRVDVKAGDRTFQTTAKTLNRLSGKPLCRGSHYFGGESLQFDGTAEEFAQVLSQLRNPKKNVCKHDFLLQHEAYTTPVGDDNDLSRQTIIRIVRKEQYGWDRFVAGHSPFLSCPQVDFFGGRLSKRTRASPFKKQVVQQPLLTSDPFTWSVNLECPNDYSAIGQMNLCFKTNDAVKNVAELFSRVTLSILGKPDDSDAPLTHTASFIEFYARLCGKPALIVQRENDKCYWVTVPLWFFNCKHLDASLVRPMGRFTLSAVIENKRASPSLVYEIFQMTDCDAKSFFSKSLVISSHIMSKDVVFHADCSNAANEGPTTQISAETFVTTERFIATSAIYMFVCDVETGEPIPCVMSGKMFLGTHRYTVSPFHNVMHQERSCADTRDDKRRTYDSSVWILTPSCQSAITYEYNGHINIEKGDEIKAQLSIRLASKDTQQSEQTEKAQQQTEKKSTKYEFHVWIDSRNSFESYANSARWF